MAIRTISIIRREPTRPLTPTPEKASLATKAGRLLRAGRAWLKAGAPVTPPEVREARRALCDACDYFRPAGNLGLGKCTAPGCGCTRGKLWLATEKCPLNKWGAVTLPPNR